MSTLKCPECGLVNFASATECKRCHFDFGESERSRDISRLKCPECGLVNFASATECKRCHSKFGVPKPQADIPSKPVAAISIPDQLAPELTTEDPALQEPGAENEPAGTFAPLPEYFDAEPAPYTIGMILFAVTVGVSMLLLAYQLKQYSSFYGGEEWKALVNPTNRLYLPSLEFLFFFGWLVKVLAIFASLLLIFFFLLKSYAFLKWVPVYLIATFIFILADGLAGRQMETALREKGLGIALEPFIDQLHWYLYLYGIAILLTVVGFRYFTTSKRVKRTFIN